MTNSTTERIETNAIVPPGEFLQELLEERGLSQRDLAGLMGRSVTVVNEIIKGKRAITAETALQLEDATGVSAEMWMRHEAGYRLALARRERAPVDQREKIVRIFVSHVMDEPDDPALRFVRFVQGVRSITPNITQAITDSAAWLDTDEFKATELWTEHQDDPKAFNSLRDVARLLNEDMPGERDVFSLRPQ